LTQSVGAAGTGATPIAVATVAGCTWAATSNATWITIASGASGNGNGAVTVTIAANSGAARAGTLTVAGQTVTINQATGCVYSVTPTSLSVTRDGTGVVPIVVSTVAGCGWTAVSSAPWITITAGASGSGAGTVAIAVASNAGAMRSGTLTVAGATVTVDQAKR
jgi:hypothetical protein